jgi:hypothetical protein
LKPPTRKWLTMDDRGSFSSRVSQLIHLRSTWPR